MIIDITKSGYRKGYLPRHGVGVFHPFFATANAAFRRSALLAVDGFDHQCATGEDIDLCIRVARADYELWFEPSAKVTHFHRSTLRGLLVQWFRYGYGHAYLFRKHGPARRLEFYRYDLSETNDSPFGIARVLSVPSPIRGMVFLSSYHAMHAGLLAGMAAFVAGARAVGWTALLSAAVAAAWYFAPGLDVETPFRSIALSALRYVADGAYVLGGVLGGLSQRMIYLEATRTRRDRGADAGEDE